MPRAVELLGGGILGFIAGSFLCAPLIAHVFGPTTVTWDASACPPGIYTITSTATSLNDSRTFTATTQHIRLPQPSITQDFGELPPGFYNVSAVARDAKGRIFNSDSQSVGGQAQSRGHQAGQNVVVSGYTPAASAPPSSSKATTVFPVPARSTPAPAPIEIYPRQVRLSPIIEERLRTVDGVLDLLESFPWWKSISFVDSDADGVAELVRIELTSGEVLEATFRSNIPASIGR